VLIKKACFGIIKIVNMIKMDCNVKKYTYFLSVLKFVQIYLIISVLKKFVIKFILINVILTKQKPNATICTVHFYILIFPKKIFSILNFIYNFTIYIFIFLLYVYCLSFIIYINLLYYFFLLKYNFKFKLKY
jgi:hypothetical protein